MENKEMKIEWSKRDRVREHVAARMHYIWAKWVGNFLANRSDESISRWMRQMYTSYSNLSEQEKESDRKSADEILAILGLACVDREAEPPGVPEPETILYTKESLRLFVYEKAQRDMVQAGWVKEVGHGD